MSRKGIKNNEGLPMDLMAFFRENPGEELTLDDVAGKFGVHYKTAQQAVRRLCDESALEAVRVVRLPSGAPRGI